MPAASNNDVFQVRVGAAGRPFDAPTSLPVLQSALAAGVWIESSCRNGTCRSCICRLASGQVVYRMEWPGLSAEEKADGYILPCVAYPASDLVIQAPAQES